MPFSDAFQSYNHYQNSSFKQNPAQRDASSRNDEIYAAARREREARARSKTKDSAAADNARRTGELGRDREGEAQGDLEWRHDLGAPTTTMESGEGEKRSEGDGKPLPDFEVDDRGNAYLKSGGGGSGWWKKAKGAFRRKSAEEDVVR